MTEDLFILPATGKMSRNYVVYIPQLVALSALRLSCCCGYDHIFVEVLGLDFKSRARALSLLYVTKNQAVLSIPYNRNFLYLI